MFSYGPLVVTGIVRIQWRGCSLTWQVNVAWTSVCLVGKERKGQTLHELWRKKLQDLDMV